MKVKEILVVGAGIAGCAVALALAKRGIGVTILTSPFDQRFYHGLFVKQEELENKIKKIQNDHEDYQSCSRAHEQLIQSARKSMDELLEKYYLIDRNGHFDIHRCLQEQLKQLSNVEWITHHTVIELLTLHQHSQKKADRYKKPACAGVIAFNHDTQKVDYFFAKETILATGGASSLYPYSTHSASTCGDGIAMAYRAGARLVNMEHVQFHPICFYQKGRPSFPLPVELLFEGGKILTSKSLPLEIDLAGNLNEQLYRALLKNNGEHLWLDLTSLNHDNIKDKFPSVDSYCLNHGYNIVKELLPIVPSACYTCGGIAIDRSAQTSLQRLRAVGESACTGLFWNYKEESLSILESLTWAVACAEDIAKQTPKLVYYFPEFKEEAYHIEPSPPVIEEDWKTLKDIMWNYVGIRQDRTHLERGCALLEQLFSANAPLEGAKLHLEQLQLFYAIQTGKIIAYAMKNQLGTQFSHSLMRKAVLV